MVNKILGNSICCAIKISSLLFISCSNQAPKYPKENNTTPVTKAAPGKPQGSFSDTLTIAFPSAVFFSPDSIQLEKIKSITDPAGFESMTHENFFLMRNAKLEIKKNRPGIKIMEVNKFRYLLFKKIETGNTCIDLDSIPDSFGLFLFDGKKTPLLTDMANIGTEEGFYFDADSFKKK
jgi:hypothetical protein